MIVNGTNITISRSEAFTVDYTFVNKDGSPFIISNELLHPYMLISITSNEFDTQNTYEYNVWCNASQYYRFSSTTPVQIPNTQTFDEGTYDGKGTDITGREYCNDCVFYCLEDGKYYVYKYDSEIGQGDAGYYEYSLRLIFTFDSDVTREWSAQNYCYKISLVDTESVVEEGTDAVNVTFTIPLLSQSTIYVSSNIGGNN